MADTAMTDKAHLHLSLGPVQSFIGQARRTRDLWAGSFLLSWLSGKAMAAIQPAHGRIVFPIVDDDALFQAIGGNPLAGAKTWPSIGSLPNRFKAEIQGDGRQAAEAAREAVKAAWKKLAEQVWEHFIEPVAGSGNGTRKIWDRQIATFWEISYVLTPPGVEDGSALDSRKNWRSHQPPSEEAGDHCRIMGDWQELSGWVRSRSALDREAQDKFWQELREGIDRSLYGKVKQLGTLELRRNERLCAISLIKRLFPVLPEARIVAALGFVPDRPVVYADSDRRYARIRKWPSTAYMAAIPWLDNAWSATQEGRTFDPAKAGACWRYYERIKDEGRGDDDMAVLTEAERTPRIARMARMEQFGNLDGTLFFEDAILNDSVDLLARGEHKIDDGRARRLVAGLKALQKAVTPMAADASARRRKRRPSTPCC